MHRRTESVMTAMGIRVSVFIITYAQVFSFFSLSLSVSFCFSRLLPLCVCVRWKRCDMIQVDNKQKRKEVFTQKSKNYTRQKSRIEIDLIRERRNEIFSTCVCICVYTMVFARASCCSHLLQSHPSLGHDISHAAAEKRL